MEQSFLFLLVEISLCFFITLGLLLYYARKNINKVVFLTALLTWFLNFVLVIILPFDIYYTQTETGIKNGIPEKTKLIIEYGYSITYWSLFIISWIFIPLMQCYESSGEFTKLEKLKSSLRENLIYYAILTAVSIIILIIALIKIGFENTLPLAKDCSLIFGILLFFFLLSYSLIKYPKTLFAKLHLKKQIIYHEWRANQFYEKLEEIKFDLIERFIRLRKTIDALTEIDENEEEERNKKESINTSILSGKKNKKRRISLNSLSNLSDKPKQMKDYLEYMDEKYNDFDKISSEYGINLKNEKKVDQKPIEKIEDLIELNRKINKKLKDHLKMQCRIRNCYRRWSILSTILYFKSDDSIYDNKKEKNKIDIKQIEDGKKDEDLLIKSEINLEGEGFIPLEDFAKCELFYYSKIKIYFIFLLFILNIIAGLLTVFCEILLLFKFDLLFKLLSRINNIILLHFVILIPLLYLIYMSNYTLFKIKISSYIYMYGHRQTDSVSLMIFSSYLSRIYFAICLNFLQTINQFTKNKSKFEEFFGIMQTEEESNLIIKLCRLSPYVLMVFIFLFILNIPGKIGNLVGYNMFEFESEERDYGIKEGHKYLMVLNKKLNGKQLAYHDSKIFEDK